MIYTSEYPHLQIKIRRLTFDNKFRSALNLSTLVLGLADVFARVLFKHLWNGQLNTAIPVCNLKVCTLRQLLSLLVPLDARLWRSSNVSLKSDPCSFLGR